MSTVCMRCSSKSVHLCSDKITVIIQFKTCSLWPRPLSVGDKDKIRKTEELFLRYFRCQIK